MDEKMMVDVLRRARDVEISRERKLSLPGEVLVKIGDVLNPEDVVAQAVIPSGLRSLDLARGLGVDPSEVTSFLVQDADSCLEQGDILAQVEGTFTRLVRMPFDGRLIACQDGKAQIATGNLVIRKQAGLIGKVEDIIPDYGVVIRVRGYLVQGIWGNGRVNCGVLHSSLDLSERVKDGAVLDEIEKGQVVVLPSCLNLELLERLEQKEVAGLILGSLSPDLIRRVQAAPMPVLVLQGFGDLPADPDTFELLSLSNGKLCCLNAGSTDELTGQRPEVIIPNEVAQDEPAQDVSAQEVSAQDEPAQEPTRIGFREKLRVGQKVQIHSGLYLGRTGTLVDLPSTPKTFESGISCLTAQVQLGDEETVTVPRQNLFMIA